VPFQHPVVAPLQGMIKDIPPELIPDGAWQESKNGWFRKGEIDQFKGYSNFLSSDLADLKPVQHIDEYFKFDGSSTLLFFTEDTIYRYDVPTTAGISISPITFTATPINSWTSEIFNDFAYAGNLQDGLYKWAGSGNFAAIASSPKMHRLLSFRGYLFGFKIIDAGTNFFQRVQWTDEGNGDNWTTGDAGSIDLKAGSDWIVTGEIIGDFITVYKERSIHLIGFVGGTLVFGHREVVPGIGLVAKGAIQNLGNDHLFLGPEDFYIFNGISVRPVGTQISKWFFDRLHPTHKHNIRSTLIEEEGIVIFSYPSTSSTDGFPDEAIVFDLEREIWTERPLPAVSFGFYTRQVDQQIDQQINTIDSYTDPFDSRLVLASFPLNLFGNKAGKIFLLDDTDQADGVVINGTLVSKEFSQFETHSPGQPPTIVATIQDIKYISRVWFDITGFGVDTDVKISVGGRDLVTDPVIYDGPVNLSIDDAGLGFTDHRVANKLITLKIETTKSFKLRSFRFEYEVGGPRG